MAARTVIVLTSIDPHTGFYYTSAQSGGTGALFTETGANVFSMTLLIAAAVFLLAMRFTRHRATAPISDSAPLAMASFLVAASLFFDIASQLFTRLSSLTLGDYLVIGLAVLSGIYFILRGLALWQGKSGSPSLWSLTVVLWGLAKLILTFTRFNGITQISENTYDIFAIALLMIFWLFHAKLVDSTDTRRSLNWIYGFGVPAAVAGLMVTIPRYFAMIFVEQEFITSASPEFTGLTMSLYIFVFLGTYLRRADRAPAEILEEPDENSTNEASETCVTPSGGFVQLPPLAPGVIDGQAQAEPTEQKEDFNQ